MKPPMEEEFRETAEMFYKKWGFPNCLGSVDGKHIRIAVCDTDCKFTFIEVGAFGKQSDGGTFRMSVLYDKMVKGVLHIPEDDFLPGTAVKAPFVFIGDEAYPLLRHMMKPFARRNLDCSNEKFNKVLSRTRKTVEFAFGIAAAKWQLLNKPIETKVETAELIVKAVCILHNMIVDKENVLNNVEYRDVLPGVQPSRRNNAAPAEAIEIRNLFKRFFNE
ncbi:uncharacterized protein LOC124775877 [Schistocerca piceifrons]|uniref:uncharacterized protein LOC124775877 n=1 Tax=Schistocerca piceifrons TaxID=274613 RepID=UPI001F5EEC7E|nr:uncharacterized protein LOC124775877 [Schistocerca piceifrons]